MIRHSHRSACISSAAFAASRSETWYKSGAATQGSAASFKRSRRPRLREAAEEPTASGDARRKAPEHTAGQPPATPRTRARRPPVQQHFRKAGIRSKNEAKRKSRRSCPSNPPAAGGAEELPTSPPPTPGAHALPCTRLRNPWGKSIPGPGLLLLSGHLPQRLWAIPVEEDIASGGFVFSQTSQLQSPISFRPPSLIILIYFLFQVSLRLKHGEQTSLSLLSPGAAARRSARFPLPHAGPHPAGTHRHGEAGGGQRDGAVSPRCAHLPAGPTLSLWLGTGPQRSAPGAGIAAGASQTRSWAKLPGTARERGREGAVPCPAPRWPLPSRAGTGRRGCPPAVHERHAVLAFEGRIQPTHAALAGPQPLAGK